jgi:hypothetical protein
LSWPVTWHLFVFARPGVRRTEMCRDVIGADAGFRPLASLLTDMINDVVKRHQLDDRVAGHPGRGVHLPEPGPVPGGVGDLQRPAAVEGHRPVPTEADARRARPAQRPGQHLEQRLHRGGPDPRRQRPQPPLPGAGLLQHRIHQLKRHDPGQLAQVAGGERPGCNRDRPGNARNSTTDGRIGTQRRSLATGRSWSTTRLTGPPLPCPPNPATQPNRLTAGRNP